MEAGALDLPVAGVLGFEEPLVAFSFAGVLGAFAADLGVLTLVALAIDARRGVLVGYWRECIS